ncbi:hypothetical protein DSCO28_28330 [Desulfosarcina ovata subsp. sediminis]|uniref:Uncharacterized protein n=2 Tax=Desulfosarcina ovata TaxID=83564 RepID=A0A5K8AAF4_9BACT|nr:hypothetical protein DSCO28_28330 [Desulfosarcina ovata subsp. sediminis]BBO89479.1 hypothetical protein DSCOOX_26590 [Desulfosarcina ovata subsp. ovata]
MPGLPGTDSTRGQDLPHCRSPQARHRWWHVTGTVFKWVGATSAILSLLSLSIQLSEIF